MRDSLRYLCAAALTMMALALFFIALGIYADPYRVFGSDRLAIAPRAYQQSDMAKAYMLERVRPRTLLLGNSRVEVGFDPDSDAWPANLKPVFDAAEAGQGLFAARLLLQHDLAVTPPKLVIVSADFPDFLGGGAMEPPVAPRELRLRADRNGNPQPNRGFQHLKDILASTLTIDAVYDTLATLAGQDARGGITMTKNGGNPLREYDAIERHEGYHSVFAQKMADYDAGFARARPEDFAQPSNSGEFSQLAHIVQAATSHSVPVVVFVNPYHALYLEMLRQRGFWQSLEDWKRALVRVVADAAGPRPDLVRIYDFSGYSAITTEQIPAGGDHAAKMRWYWEAGHYKKALGDVLISGIVSGKPQIGMQVDANTIEADLQRVRSERDAYLLAHGRPPGLD